MSRSQRRSHAPRAGATLVDALFQRIGLSAKAREYRALHAWHHMAGKRLGQHSRAERVRGSTLFVRVASAPWANELSYLRAGLLEKLRATPGAEWIEELRFSIGPISELPDWEQELDRAPLPAVPSPPVVDGGKVAAELLKVRDPELRAALAELFARAHSTR